MGLKLMIFQLQTECFNHWTLMRCKMTSWLPPHNLGTWTTDVMRSHNYLCQTNWSAGVYSRTPVFLVRCHLRQRGAFWNWTVTNGCWMRVEAWLQRVWEPPYPSPSNWYPWNWRYDFAVVVDDDGDAAAAAVFVVAAVVARININPMIFLNK